MRIRPEDNFEGTAPAVKSFELVYSVVHMSTSPTTCRCLRLHINGLWCRSSYNLGVQIGLFITNCRFNTHASAFSSMQGLRTSQEMREVVQSPQFQQQVETFSAVSSSNLYPCLRFCSQEPFSCLLALPFQIVLALEGSERCYLGNMSL
jgi:hypothetical protein